MDHTICKCKYIICCNALCYRDCFSFLQYQQSLKCSQFKGIILNFLSNFVFDTIAANTHFIMYYAFLHSTPTYILKCTSLFSYQPCQILSSCKYILECVIVLVLLCNMVCDLEHLFLFSQLEAKLLWSTSYVSWQGDRLFCCEQLKHSQQKPSIVKSDHVRQSHPYIYRNTALFTTCGLTSPETIMNLSILTPFQDIISFLDEFQVLSLEFEPYTCIKHTYWSSNFNLNMHTLIVGSIHQNRLLAEDLEVSLAWADFAGSTPE